MAENATPAPSSLVTTKRRAEDGEVITLAQPRPGTARRINEYIETPLKPKGRCVPLKDALTLPRPAITAQPKKTVDKSSDSDSSSDADQTQHGDSGVASGESIICRQCGRCRCDDCRTPRLLPQRWICHDKFLCSGQAAVDFCSCLCCVKGVFYHWGQNYGEAEGEGVSCADQPCSCAPDQCCLRWGCLGLLSLALPCLCCYWPLRGCLRLTEKAYARVTSHGCQCNSGLKATQTISRTEKRLLEPEC